MLLGLFWREAECTLDGMCLFDRSIDSVSSER